MMLYRSPFRAAAHLFHGVIEQNVIFHVCVEALGLEATAPTADSAEPSSP